MKVLSNTNGSRASRRSFLRGGLAVAAAPLAFGQEMETGALPSGDAAILRFLAAAGIIESDLWLQYAELGGTQDSELPGLPTGGNPVYTAKLETLDPDMPQCIHDNTEDELTHQAFLNFYLVARGAAPVDLHAFRTLQGSKATGANQVGRLTNLMQLSVDTSWWTRYRSRTQNPDLDPSFVFPQAVPALSVGKFPAIPRSDADLTPDDHIQAIANTAGFHFAFIEQGGTSLYPSLAQRVTSPEVLRILLSIGPTETAHFQTWHDKAGNATPLTDPTNGLTFPDLNSPPFGGEDFQTNLIMPEPCPFLSRKFPVCSIIRPTQTNGAAMAAVQALAADGLFIGQSKVFLELLQDLAADADRAQRGN